jgi:uncharacterized protein YbjT (DUF2867 family)
MRTQLVAARAVAGVLADRATEPGPADVSLTEIASPREGSMVEMAELLAARRGHPGQDRGREQPRPTLTASSTKTAPCFPAPGAILTGPTFEGWLDSAPGPAGAPGSPGLGPGASLAA